MNEKPNEPIMPTNIYDQCMNAPQIGEYVGGQVKVYEDQKGLSGYGRTEIVSGDKRITVFMSISWGRRIPEAMVVVKGEEVYQFSFQSNPNSTSAFQGDKLVVDRSTGETVGYASGNSVDMVVAKKFFPDNPELVKASGSSVFSIYNDEVREKVK